MDIVLQSNLISWHCMLTALFINRQILKFKSELTFAFFPVISHLSWPLRKQNFTLTGSKGHGFVICDWWISIHFVCFCLSGFVAHDCNYDWQQWKMQLWRQLLNFRVFVKSAVINPTIQNSSFYKFLLQCTVCANVLSHSSDIRSCRTWKSLHS